MHLPYTDKKKSYGFQSSCVIKTGLTDFHRMIITTTKMVFHKYRPRAINIEVINISIMKIIELPSEISNFGPRSDDSDFSEFFVVPGCSAEQK